MPTRTLSPASVTDLGAVAPAAVRSSAPRHALLGLSARSRFALTMRLAAPWMAAVVAFPFTADALVRGAAATPTTATALAAVALTVFVATTVFSRPRPGEPAIHDRQLDVILAIPPLLLAVWLTFGWPGGAAQAAPAGSAAVRAVVAVTCFLLTVSLVTGGTRLTRRLRCTLLSPLILLPAAAGSPVATVLVGGGYVAVMSAWVVVRVRRAPEQRDRVAAAGLGGGLVAPATAAVTVTALVAAFVLSTLIWRW